MYEGKNCLTELSHKSVANVHVYILLSLKYRIVLEAEFSPVSSWKWLLQCCWKMFCYSRTFSNHTEETILKNSQVKALLPMQLILFMENF